MLKFAFHEKTWEEIKELSRSPNSVVILPLGTVEQHGPHLPLGTDTFILEDIIVEGCKKSRYKNHILILPIVPYGFSHLHIRFPGTISIDDTLLKEFIYTIGESVLAMGFKKLLLISWHGGHHSIMHDVAYRLKKKFKNVIVVYASVIEMVFDKVKDLLEGPVYHADDLETSLMLALNQRVLLQKAVRNGETGYLNNYISLDFKRKSKVKIPVAIDEFTQSGVIGDPTKASRDKGAKILKIITDELSKLLETISGF